jgi:TolA-binding protein
MTSLIGWALLIVACGGMNEEEAWNKAQQFHAEKNYQEALKYYQIIIDKYPQSPKASQASYLAASIYNNDLKDFPTAIRWYRKMYENYPESKDAPNALFTIGFIYNNELKEYDSARAYYQKFLQKYPNHDMAISAKFELENIGKDPNEILNLQTTLADTIKKK